MKAFLSVGVLLISASFAQAHVIEKGADIEQLESEMKAANYRPTGLAMGVISTQENPLALRFWSVDDGVLIVTYSTVSNKVQGMSFYFCDERPKAFRKTFNFEVTRFDTKTGEIVIQTKRAEDSTSN